MADTKTLKTRIKLKTGTASKWEAITTTPLEGELLIYDEADGTTPRLKVGTGVDGSTPSTLPFIGSEIGTTSAAATQSEGGMVTSITYNKTTGKLDIAKIKGVTDSEYIGHKHTFSVPASTGTVTKPTFTGTEVESKTPNNTVTVAGSAHTHKLTAAGTITAPTFTGSECTTSSLSGTTTVNSVSSVGSAPSWNATIGTDKCMTFTWSAGSVPTLTAMTVATGTHIHKLTPAGTISEPKFTGTAVTSDGPSATATVASNDHTHKVTAKGDVSQPTFTGTDAQTLTTNTPS